MGRVSLMVLLQRQGKLDAAIKGMSENDNPVEWLKQFANCSLATAQKLHDDLFSELRKQTTPKEEKPITENKPQKVTKADLEEVKKQTKKPLWAVCTKPLRGVYLRPNAKGEDESYNHVNLYLGCVHASTESEAIELAKAKYEITKILDDNVLFGFKVLS